jgi:hypothetical protein
MRRLCVVLAALSLAAPAGARASTHLWLDVRSSRLSPAGLGGWQLRFTGATDDNLSEAGAPDHGSFGAGLLLQRPRFEETHGYAPGGTAEISFDGFAGQLRIDRASNGALAADLRIQATGMPTPHLAEACPGSPMLEVPVRLVGTLTLETGTRFFGTVRTAALSGTILYNDGPPGACYATADAPPSICGHGTMLYSNADLARFVTVRWETPPLYRVASIVFRPPSEPGWGHALEVRLRRSPFSGGLGSLRAAVRTGPLRGSMRFQLSRRQQDTPDPRCPGPLVTRARGTLTGRFVAAFHGWGTRTLVLRHTAGFALVE